MKVLLLLSLLFISLTFSFAQGDEIEDDDRINKCPPGEYFYPKGNKCVKKCPGKYEGVKGKCILLNNDKNPIPGLKSKTGETETCPIDAKKSAIRINSRSRSLSIPPLSITNENGARKKVIKQ